MQSVFICYTPLHTLISERIVKDYKIDKCHLIFLSPSNNRKNRYYFDRVSSLFDYSKFVSISNKLHYDWRKIIFTCKNFKHEARSEEVTIYCGNIKRAYSRLVCHYLDYKKIITFDDGLQNIGGDYFLTEGENPLSKLFFQIQNKSLTYKNVKRQISKHISIFKYKNAFENVELLELFPQDDKIHDVDTEIKIFLSSAFTETGDMKLAEEIDIYEKIISKFNITHVLPHPREKFTKITSKDVILINTELIAEEYIAKLKEKHSVKVYGVYSTALLTLSTIAGIKCFNIANTSFKMNLDSIFSELNIEKEHI